MANSIAMTLTVHDTGPARPQGSSFVETTGMTTVTGLSTVTTPTAKELRNALFPKKSATTTSMMTETAWLIVTTLTAK
jgi:hypothetical protein